MVHQHTREPIKVLFVRWLNNRFNSLSNLRIIKHLLPLQMRASINCRQLHAQREGSSSVNTLWLE
jgi:hypothetical protein